jgi:hypothetical protein
MDSLWRASGDPMESQWRANRKSIGHFRFGGLRVDELMISLLATK